MCYLIQFTMVHLLIILWKFYKTTMIFCFNYIIFNIPLKQNILVTSTILNISIILIIHIFFINYFKILLHKKFFYEWRLSSSSFPYLYLRFIWPKIIIFTFKSMVIKKAIFIVFRIQTIKVRLHFTTIRT